MRCIARDKSAAFCKLVRHQREAGLPRRFGHQLKVKLCAHGGKQRSPVVHRLGRLAGLELQRKHEFLGAVDGNHQAALNRVHGPVHPGLLFAEHGIQCGRLEIQRQHLASKKVSLFLTLAAVLNTAGLAHQAAWAVAADDVFGL